MHNVIEQSVDEDDILDCIEEIIKKSKTKSVDSHVCINPDSIFGTVVIVEQLWSEANNFTEYRY